MRSPQPPPAPPSPVDQRAEVQGARRCVTLACTWQPLFPADSEFDLLSRVRPRLYRDVIVSGWTLSYSTAVTAHNAPTSLTDLSLVVDHTSLSLRSMSRAVVVAVLRDTAGVSDAGRANGQGVAGV